MKTKNKKGILPALVLPIAIAIIALILVGAFIFSGTLRLILIGVGLFGGVIYLLGTVKSDKVKLISILILISVGIFFIFGADFIKEMVYPTITPVFCNDYEFTCCNEVEWYDQSFAISHKNAWVCPDTASKCEITRASPGTEIVKIGSGNCYYKTGILSYWTCDSVRVWQTMYKTVTSGYYLWADKLFGSIDLDIVMFIEKLVFCGRSGCTVGVPVSGADGCTFSPNNNIVYTSTSALTGKVITPSYTVPAGQCVLAFQSGDRHICGYKEETCDTNADCGGHTYGNVECSGRTKQTYGCRSFGTPITTTDRGPFDSGWGTDATQTSLNTFGKRCEIIKAETVQCCGDYDCGSGMFCDTTTFTCKQEVECVYDSDCGVSQICDFAAKELTKPACVGGQCTRKVIQEVECCSTDDCPTGYYCSTNYECLLSAVPKIACPFECCTGETEYIDKECAEGEYCIDNVCMIEPCETDADCPGDKICVDGDCVDKVIPPVIECKWWEVYYEKEVTDCGFLNWREWAPFFKCKTHTESGCKLAEWIWLAGGIIMLVLLIILVLVIPRKKTARKKRK